MSQATRGPVVPDSPEARAETIGADANGSVGEDLGVLADLLQLARGYLRDNRLPGTPVVDYRDPRELGQLFDLAIGRDGIADKDLLPLLEAYLRYSVRTAHPQFYNQLFGGFSLAGFLGDVVSCLTNTTMCTYEAAPLATLMERELVAKMNRLVGYEHVDGIFCTGGSNANMLGVLCARHRAFPQIKCEGFPDGVRPTLFVSDQAHYSFAKAANVLGLGSDNAVAVETDSCGRMIPSRLEREIERSRSRGCTPFFVGATAGTTVLGAFDPIREIAEVARRHGLWLHVDGSWGGPVLLSERHRRLLDGKELSDSFSWDAHKMMGATLTCTAFLTRHGRILHEGCCASDSDAEYILHVKQDGALDTGRSSLQCGRRVDALKLWLMWKRFGDRGFAARIDRLFDLARYAESKVSRDDRLELICPVQSVNVCFRHVPEGVSDVNAFNLLLRERLHRSGAAFVNYATIDGRLAIRLVFSNPDVTSDDVDRFFALVFEAVADLSAAGLESTRSVP